jgi:hypothetical protein
VVGVGHGLAETGFSAGHLASRGQRRFPSLGSMTYAPLQSIMKMVFMSSGSRRVGVGYVHGLGERSS